MGFNPTYRPPWTRIMGLPVRVIVISCIHLCWFVRALRLVFCATQRRPLLVRAVQHFCMVTRWTTCRKDKSDSQSCSVRFSNLGLLIELGYAMAVNRMLVLPPPRPTLILALFA